jgi:class 3 adenylate cyclase
VDSLTDSPSHDLGAGKRRQFGDGRVPTLDTMSRGIRKTVTVIFVDVADSTQLGSELDPEPARRLMLRYFETVGDALRRHGGTVEKFIGDAVMAVFGVPVVHEDDALRAVRAAVEAREAISELNEELERERGVRIAINIGVNTGEVFAGEGGNPYTLVTGDAVNVAARLQHTAGRNEILIGDATYRLGSASRGSWRSSPRRSQTRPRSLPADVFPTERGSLSGRCARLFRTWPETIREPRSARY